MAALADDLGWEGDRRSVTSLIFLDLVVALGTMILSHLSGLGLDGTILLWFQYYLEDRFQKVLLVDCCSAPWPLA